MTKKDYIEVARIINHGSHIAARLSTDPLVEQGALVMRRYMGDKLADLFARDNGRFDRERFMAACGL